MSELCGLTLEETDLARAATWIKGKGRRERELVPLPRLVVDVVRRYLRHRRGAGQGQARKRGPKSQPVDPRVKQLESANRKLQRKLQRAETIITLQKRVAEILGIPLKALDNDETD